KSANACQELQIAPAHGFARNLNLVSCPTDLIQLVELEILRTNPDAIVMKPQDGIGKFTLGNSRARTMQQKFIILARQKIAPQAFFIAYDKIGIIAMACPGKGRRFVEPDSLLAENQF